MRDARFIGYRVSAIGYRLSVIEYRISVIGYRLSVIGYRPSARVERQERLRIRRADIVRTRTNQPVVRVLLQAVRGPPRDAADGEDRREQIDRDAERVVRGRRVEVDVRIELLLPCHELLDALRH